MSEKIEVEISDKELEAQGPSDTARGIVIVRKLREAGIPVKGILAIHGVTAGSLSMTYDEMFGQNVYTWTPG